MHIYGDLTFAGHTDDKGYVYVTVDDPYQGVTVIHLNRRQVQAMCFEMRVRDNELFDMLRLK